MKSKRGKEGSVRVALLVGLSFLLLAVAVEYVSIIRMNSGVFTYTSTLS